MPEIKAKKRTFRSLSFTLTAAFLLLTLSLLLVNSGFELYFNLQSQQVAIANQQQLVAKEAADTVSSFVQERLRRLVTTARLADLVNADTKDQELILSKLLGLESSFRQLAVLDPQKQELYKVSRLSKTESGQFMKRIGSNFFSKIDEGQTSLSQVYIDEITSEPMIIMAVAVRDIFGSFKGILAAEVNLKFMWDLVGNIKIGENGTVFVVDRLGNLIAFSDISRVLKRENLSGLKEVNEFINNEELVKRADQAKGIYGTSVVSTFVSLGTPDWAVIVELPFWEAYNSIVRQIIIMVAVMILIFCLAIVTVVFLSKRIVRPIINLRNAAIEIGEGKLDKEIQIEKEDEIGELARTFNFMIGKLKQQKEREEAVSKMKSEFISITAHQLRTPLSSLKWTFDLMREGDLGEFTKEQKEYLENCRKANEKMIDTINDLLDVTRIEEGRFLYEYNQIQLEDLIQEIIDNSKLEAIRKKISIKYKKPSTPLPLIKIDAEKMTLAIKNFFENAIRYTPSGGEVDISLDRKPEEVIFKIRDNGIGIPESQKYRIFEKFFRAHNALVVETSGSGLGLYITKNIIEKHGGKVWFESEENKGTTFSFSLPLPV